MLVWTIQDECLYLAWRGTADDFLVILLLPSPFRSLSCTADDVFCRSRRDSTYLLAVVYTVQAQSL